MNKLHKLNPRLHYLFMVMSLGLMSSSCSVLRSPNQSMNENDPFTLIVFPDTQMYAKDRPEYRQTSRKEIFNSMSKWVVERSKPDNIKFVLHVGDIVNEEFEPYQWQNANDAISLLDGNVPYCFAVGNHDLVNDSTRNTTNFNSMFPYSRYESEDWYGGRMINDGYMPNDNYDNSYHFFNAGGMDFMIVSLECGPTDDMIKWANDIILQNSNKNVIVLTHSYMLGNNKRDGTTNYLPPSPPANSGEQLWHKLIKKHPNIFLVLSGHHENLPEYKGLLTSTGIHGNKVHQLLCGDWFDGWIRVLEFKPIQNKISVRTYSPWRPKSIVHQWRNYGFDLPNYNTDQFHEFELDFNMNGD